MTVFSILQPNDLSFGRGCAAHAARKVLGFGRRVLLVRGRSVRWCDDFHADLVAAGAKVTVLPCSREPHLSDVVAATDAARAAQVDVVVAVGGGSVIDLAKATAALINATHPLIDYLEGVGSGRALDAVPVPFVAIPTTAGTGAEVTRNAVIAVPEHRKKVSLRATSMMADVVFVDAALTDHSPAVVTFGSGFDALVQVMEPYLSSRATPYTDALCRDGIPRGLRALLQLADGEDQSARDDLAVVSLFGGLALTNAGLGAAHGLAGVIGGWSDVPHGALCGRLIGATLQVNWEACQRSGIDVSRFEEVFRWIDAAMGGPDHPVLKFAGLVEKCSVPILPILSEMTPQEREDVTTAALVSSSMSANITQLSRADVLKILDMSRDFQGHGA